MRSPTRHLLPLLVAVASISVARPAAAQDAGDLARAEVLFDKATKLMEGGDVAAACPVFADSQSIVRGIGVTLFLGECYERLGKTASAWAQFRMAESLASAKNDARSSVAQERAQRLEATMPTLVIRVAPPAEAPGLEVKRDGATLARSEWGTPEPIDPGDHVVTASAPQRTPWRSIVKVAAAKGLIVVDVPPLSDPRESEAPPTPETPPQPAPSRGRGQRLIGLGGMGLGVVGVGIGSVAGLIALSKFHASNPDCPSNDQCTQPGLDLRHAGESAATVSNVAFIAGGLAAAGGLVLYLTAPRSSTSVAFVPTLGPRDAALVLRGAF